MSVIDLQDPVLDATDAHTRLLLLAEYWKREAMLHKSRADTQREELMRTWFVLKELGHHPGRTDDRLSDCVRRGLESPVSPRPYEAPPTVVQPIERPSTAAPAGFRVWSDINTDSGPPSEAQMLGGDLWGGGRF
jgi:hypothetical protein